MQPLAHLLTGPVVDGGERFIQKLGRRPRSVRGEGVARGPHTWLRQTSGPAYLIRRLGQCVVGVGTLGRLPGTTWNLGAAAGGCGVVTQSGFLDGGGAGGTLLRRELTSKRKAVTPDPPAPSRGS